MSNLPLGGKAAKFDLSSPVNAAAIHAATALFQLTIEGKGDLEEQKRLLSLKVNQHAETIAAMAINILYHFYSHASAP